MLAVTLGPGFIPGPLSLAVSMARDLDKIEHAFRTGDGLGWHEHDHRLFHGVERFFRLWCRNQWKRERYAPSFHVDDENLDPKTWCRFPILSGGFERELGQLRAYLAKIER